ncbi:MAG TPA: LysR substrate-binding domain-containing protein [Streptosporangiaceae bacterium]|nr:LysR substrate-binding domain-containing protein [Streptosporangiaceae bacterium]
MASSTNSRVRSSGLRAVTDVIATPFPPSPGWPARLPLAAAALSAVGGIRLAVSELTGLLRGQATIGTVTSPNVDLPGILAEFRRRHPLVEITLSEESTSDLLDGVRSGRLDGVIASVGTTPPPGVELQVIVDQPVVAAVSHDHELSGTAVIPVSGLRGRPLISLPPGTGLRARLEEACAAAGFRPLIAFEARAPEMVAELAAHGLGTAILPGPFAEFRADRLAIVRIDPELRGRLVLAWRAGGPASPAGRALISLSRQALAARDR